MSTQWQDQFDTTVKDLRRIYEECIEPVEQKYQFERFRPSHWTETLKPHKPFVLFLGPFSAGKSTFINYLLGQDYLWTGPQPTTDKFTVIMHGREYQTLSGRILCASQELPFRSLSQFGDAFLETLQGVQCPVELLRSVTFIDTPGILEAASDIHSRNYNYIQVCKWFIDRADLVFCMFDPSKLDAGVELQNLFRAMKGKEGKMRMVLNKADQVAPQELMRVYGALFWNLSNMIHSTEPPRVYVSSFWNKPYRYTQNQQLFDDEKADLMYDLVEVVPMQCLDKRVSSVLRRALDVQIHAHLVTTMRDKLPAFGKSKATKEMVKDLPKISADVANRFKLTLNDFPKPDEYTAFYDKIHLSELPTFKELEKEAKKKGTVSAVTLLDRAIKQDLPRLLTPIAQAAAKDPRQIRRDRERATDTAPGSLVPKASYLPDGDPARHVQGNFAQNAVGQPPSAVQQPMASPAAQPPMNQSFQPQQPPQQPLQPQPQQHMQPPQQPPQQVQSPVQQTPMQTPMQPQQPQQPMQQQFAPTVTSPGMQQPMQGMQQQGMMQQPMQGMQPMMMNNQMGFQQQPGMMMNQQGMMMPQQNMMGMQQPMMMNGQMMQPQMTQMAYGNMQGMQGMQPVQQQMYQQQPQQQQMYPQTPQFQTQAQTQVQPMMDGTMVQGQLPQQQMMQPQQQFTPETVGAGVKEVPMPPPQQDGEGGGSA